MFLIYLQFRTTGFIAHTYFIFVGNIKEIFRQETRDDFFTCWKRFRINYYEQKS